LCDAFAGFVPRLDIPKRFPNLGERVQPNEHYGIKFLIAVVLIAFGSDVALRADQLDEVIRDQMKKRGIAGLSLAVIDGGAVIREQGYGFTDKSGKAAVTAATLFQAGSVSKPVAALGALRLVDRGLLSLDEDVNTKLRTWTLPQNKFTDAHKVTLRLILSHSAGITVHGFPGYSVGKTIPTLTQILNGEKPANTSAIRVDRIPGSEWKYSGGGYLVVQQMMIDVTGKPFPQYMEETVLKPLGMVSSTYSQPLPEQMAARAAKGYGGIFNQPINGTWHIYPEMAAAGLWTTAGDLARFAIGIQKSVSGESNPVISQPLTREMLTNQKNNVGLGLFLKSSGKTLRFGHDGVDAGFDASMSAYAYQGKGAVVMINKNDNGDAMKQIFGVIGEQYRWPDYMIPKKE
jgi:CubicO group peptidase (beta-lactamase class C family)